jgi:hypothetical protein
LVLTAALIDRAWVRQTIASMMGGDDPRVSAWDRITA